MGPCEPRGTDAHGLEDERAQAVRGAGELRVIDGERAAQQIDAAARDATLSAQLPFRFS